jgi:L-glutamine-phosphate cytidylyltransferase
MDKSILYDGKDYDNMYIIRYLQMLISLGWDIRATFIKNGWAEVDCPADLDVALENWKPQTVAYFLN